VTVERPGDRRQPGGPGSFDGWCQRKLVYDTHLRRGGSCILFAVFVGVASFVSHAFVFVFCGAGDVTGLTLYIP